MGVQSSEMIDSKLSIYVLCPSSLLAATRIWARSDEKNCTGTSVTGTTRTRNIHTHADRAMTVMCTSRLFKCIHLWIKILGVFVTDDGFTNIVWLVEKSE